MANRDDPNGLVSDAEARFIRQELRHLNEMMGMRWSAHGDEHDSLAGTVKATADVLDAKLITLNEYIQERQLYVKTSDLQLFHGRYDDRLLRIEREQEGRAAESRGQLRMIRIVLGALSFVTALIAAWTAMRSLGALPH